VAAVSLSSKSAILKNQVTIFPVELYTRAYDIILSSRLFFTSLTNTVLLTVVNTLVAIVIAVSAAYALANKHFLGMRTALVYTLIPLYLSGGLIPFYLIVNSYGLNNTRLALMLPYLVDPFLIIVFRNAIVRLPQEIMESAEVDGASEFTILFRIVFALIIPMVAAFTIISAVFYWNMWFPVLIFIRDKWKWTLQYMLRDIYTNPLIGGGQLDVGNIVEDLENILPQNLINAAIVGTVLPVVIIYPFLQRYFIHGVIVGAVKG
jgi:putative aldouronate transport system permease protein